MVETLVYDKLMTEDVGWGTGTRQTRLLDGRVLALQEVDPGWELAYRTNDLRDYLGSGRTILISRPTVINTALTFPSTDAFVFTRGGSLTLNANVTCYSEIHANRQRLFFGTGTITFPLGAEVKAEWWGAAPGAQSATAIQTALNAGPLGMHVSLGTGTYLINSAITPTPVPEIDMRLAGSGSRRTILQRDPAYVGPLLALGSVAANITRVEVRDMEFDGVTPTAGVVGIRMIRSTQTLLENIRFRNCATGLHGSGSVYNRIRRLWFNGNDTATIVDNGEAQVGLGPTFWQFQHCMFLTSKVAHVFINGAASALTQSRQINFDHCSFENDQVVVTTDIGVKITEASQCHFTNCWWEDNSKHVEVIGNVSNHPTKNLTWSRCQFGGLRGAATVAFTFAGTYGDDGEGCKMDSCVLSEGEFNFTQEKFIRLIDTELSGSATLTGSKWFQQRSSTEAWEDYDGLVTQDVWRPRTMIKTGAAFIAKVINEEGTFTTTNATPVAAATFSVTDDTSSVVEARVLAKTAANGNQAAYALVGLFKKAAGVLTLIGAVQSLHPAIESDAAWNAELIVSAGNQVQCRVTGDAAATVRWQLSWTIRQLDDV